MMTNQEVTELYIKFINGQCTQDEIDLLLSILKDGQYKDAFPDYDLIEPFISSEDRLTADASNRIFAAVTAKETPQQAVIYSRFVRKKWWAAAASLIILCGSYYLYTTHQTTNSVKTVYNASEEKKVYQLSDGTQVTLDKGAELEVSHQFGKSPIREVWIKGDGYFNVAHNEKMPFIVHTPTGMDVKVLGTEFNVSAWEDKAFVVLNKGSVEVNAENQYVRLIPGEKALFRTAEHQIEKVAVDTVFYNAWKNNLFAFNNEALKEVARKIGRNYSCAIDIADNQLSSLTFTGYIPKNDLELALQTLRKSLNCTVDFIDGRYIIKPNQLTNYYE